MLSGLGERTTGQCKRLLAAVSLVLVALAALIGMQAAGASAHRARADSAPQCSDSYPAKRDPSNPLDLPHSPGQDPLNGAMFFVPGPAHGVAAQTIAQLVGASVGDDETWGPFRHQLHHGALARKLATNPGLAHSVAELSKIAGQPEAQRFSSYAGGGPGAIFSQVQKIFCGNLASDPALIPIINTYFMHADLGGCPAPGQVRADQPVFHRRVDEMAAATARHPAVYLLELDAIGSSSCVTKQGALSEWENDLRYEINKIAALPHTVVYVEGGYSDSNTVPYTARILNAIGIRKIRGFFTNGTHLNWTINEVHWDNRNLKADAWCALHGQHGRQRAGAAAQSPPSDPGRREPV